MTRKLYLDDPYRAEVQAEVIAVDDAWAALSATVLFPGGGGQPPDTGTLESAEGRYLVTDGRGDEEGRVWHRSEGPLKVGDPVRVSLDWSRRYAYMRHHTLLHIVNAVVLADYGGLITGVQIGEERSRIDFGLEGFARDDVPRLGRSINEVIVRDLSVDAGFVSEAEFRARPELVRTASVAPPVVEGMVRVVRIGGFDAQACGGTHVHATSELGICSIVRFDNKGKSNKRFYLALDPT
jgi:misacylated tRNA(Ala) deacylase